MAARVGEPAPDFTLAGVEGTGGARREYTLSEFQGRAVVLAFYPGDNTPVCTRQLNTYTSEIDQFAETGAQVLALSPQSVDSHEKFAADQGGFAFPLLADIGKTVGQAYGVVGPVGFYRRCAIVVDPAGVVRYAHRAMTGATFRPTAELVEAVRAATA